MSSKTTPAERIKNLYSEICVNLPAVRTLTEKRKKAVAVLLKQLSLDDIQAGFMAINNSTFCCGVNDRGWKADFDFCIRPDSLIKALEGKYAENATPTKKSNNSGGTGYKSTYEKSLDTMSDWLNEKENGYDS